MGWSVVLAGSQCGCISTLCTMLVCYQPISFPQIHINPSFTQTLCLAFPAGQVSLSSSPTRLLPCWLFHGKLKEGARPGTLSTKIFLVKTCNSSSFFEWKEVALWMKWRPLKQNMGVLALLKMSYLSWNIVN